MNDQNGGVDVSLLNKLRAPFPAETVGKLPRVVCRACASRDTKCDEHKKTICKTCRAYLGKHTHLDFVGHAHVTERLLDVDPQWEWEPLALDNAGLPAMDANGGMWIRLTVGGITRLGYGDAPGKRGGDAVKEVIGDAIRNAAMRFGVALDLWKKEPAAVHDDVPARQVERPKKTEDQRRAELRGLIAKFGKDHKRETTAIADDFVQWSQGTEITRAGADLLQQYLDYLQTEVDA